MCVWNFLQHFFIAKLLQQFIKIKIIILCETKVLFNLFEFMWQEGRQRRVVVVVLSHLICLGQLKITQG